MNRFIAVAALLAIAGSVQAKEVLICETEPVSNAVPITNQDTVFHCPKIEGGKTLPELYRSGWRLIHMTANSRPTGMGASASLVLILEKD